MKIAFLTSCYPSVSHTFIRREVAALRRRGFAIETMSVRPPEPKVHRFDEDRDEAARTWTIQKASISRMLHAHLDMLQSHPSRYVATLRLAVAHRVPGARSALWSIFHFIEACVLAEELESRGIRHLHSHFANAGGTVGMLAARLIGIDWSLSVHGSKAELDFPAAPLLGAKVSAASFVRCVSQFGASQVMRFSDSNHWNKLFVAHCGVELARLTPIRGLSTQHHDTRRIVAVGRLVPEKGQIGLVEAFGLIAERSDDVELVMIGEGPDRPRIEERIRALALESRVHLLGEQAEPEVLRTLAGADVFALASLIEGLPVVLMEAMGLGVPVVAPRLSGIPELVEHERTGLLYTPGAWSQLAKGIERLLTDEELCESMRRAATTRIEKQYDVDRAVEPLSTRFLEATTE